MAECLTEKNIAICVRPIAIRFQRKYCSKSGSNSSSAIFNNLLI